ncbi:MAG TPA: hypothetical protein PK521_14135 [Bacteroidales bacterium]|nr:hypothetical protein [Bacteroidales bacterium]
MKNLTKLLFAAIAIFMIVSCDRDKDRPEKFSTMTVEENKAAVENTGIDLVGVLERFRATKTVEAAGNMIEITESGKSKGIQGFTGTGLYSVIKAVQGAAGRTGQVNDVFEAVKGCAEEDPESIREFWDENVGTYTWNPSIGDFNTDLGGDKFIIKFPSSDVSTTNDATFTVYDYEGVTISNPLDEEYTGDLPVGLKADLKLGTQTLVTFVFGASYNEDGVPNAIAADLDIEGFKFEVDVTNDTKIVSASYKFLEKNEVIMNMSAKVNGLFTGDNINDNSVQHTDRWVCDRVLNPNTQEYEDVYCEDTWEEVEFEEVAHTANAEFQLMNLAVRGQMDIKNLVDKIRIIEDDYYEDEAIDEETYCDRMADELNSYVNLRLVKIDNNEIIAKVEAYVINDTEWEYEDYDLGFRLTFGEGSPIDMETYFEEGFDDFIDSLNDLLEDICNDYGIDYDPIEY